MNISLSLIIMAEILLTLLFVWGYMHEEKLVAFEDKIFYYIRRRINAGRRSRETARRRRINSSAVYKPVKPSDRAKSSCSRAA